MADPDEVVQEFSSLSESELQIAEEHEDEIKNAGATYIHTYRRDEHPNRMEIWGPTQEAVDNATERYIEFQNNHTNTE